MPLVEAKNINLGIYYKIKLYYVVSTYKFEALLRDEKNVYAILTGFSFIHLDFSACSLLQFLIILCTPPLWQIHMPLLLFFA